MYWGNAVKTIFRDATEIKEDWDAKTVSLTLQSASRGIQIEFSPGLLERIQRAFGEKVSITISATADTRYADRGEFGVIITIILKNVEFPARPQVAAV